MKLSKLNQKWWDIANARRHRLIFKKHGLGSVGLTPEETAEFEMLQKVAGAVSDYSDVVLCRLCKGRLALRDLGLFPTHVCAKKKGRKP